MRLHRHILVLVLTTLVLAGACPGALAQSRVPPPSLSTRAVRFTGEVRNRPSDGALGIWVVGESAFTVVEATMVDETQGPAAIGAQVMVVAKRVTAADSVETRLEAILVRVLNPPRQWSTFTVRGIVIELQNDYLVVNGLRIDYDASTPVSGVLQLGALVRVVATRTYDGVKALRIDVLPKVLPIVEFEGVIQRMSRDLWVVGGRRVRLNAETVIDGTPAIGAKARVRGLASVTGVVLALAITIQSKPGTVEWTAPIDRLPATITIWPPVYTGRWVVGGREVWVTGETVIKGTPRIGARAHVVAAWSNSRTLSATSIEILATID